MCLRRHGSDRTAARRTPVRWPSAAPVWPNAASAARCPARPQRPGDEEEDGEEERQSWRDRSGSAAGGRMEQEGGGAEEVEAGL